MAKKRHHFLPKAYLKPFCDEEGKLHVYRKDKPEQEIRLSPDNTGFHKYYYSQATPSGRRDDDTLEDLFSEYESEWPGIVLKFRARENVNRHLDTICAFIGLQRARVPAARDACERILAENVKATIRRMRDQGDLPPLPFGLGDLFDHVDVAIDPHQSIHAMSYIMKGFDELLAQIGIEVVFNDTDMPFVTSDNPVIWFDPSTPEGEMRPYGIDLNGPIVLMFPVAPDLLIYGDTSKQKQFAQHGLIYSRPSRHNAVREMNALICRFAYESVYADRSGFSDLVREHADLSPVIRTETIPAPKGQFLYHQFVWGARTHKPKWNRPDK